MSETNQPITYVVINDRISEMQYETTFMEIHNSLQELGWVIGLHRAQRRGVNVLLDDRNVVVAVEKGYEQERW
jgi:hypothetical protein